jgi:anti-anti-sigma regulatory factor
VSLRLEQWWWDDAVVVVPGGRLDVDSCRALRDHLAKAGTDNPRAVIVDLCELDIESGAALSVFTTAHSLLARWPGVPLVLAGGNEHSRGLLASHHTGRYVPVHDNVRAAIAATAAPPPRQVEHIDLVNAPSSARVAREFVRDTCAWWDVLSVVEDAVLLANELVSNAVIHTSSASRLQIELRRGLLTVAVSDDSPQEAVVRDPGGDMSDVHGLLLVAQLATTWGCTPTWNGGKVVWATLRTP